MAPRILYYTVFPLVWLVSWLLVSGVALETRPLMLGEEQRLLSHAWWAWQENNVLFSGVSLDAGEIVWPVMPWLVNTGWALFGVSDWWPRLVGYGLGLGCVFLTAGFARLLWPGWTGLGAMSGTALGAMTVWLTLSGFLDSALASTFFMLIGLFALVWSWRTGRWDGFVYFGLCTGFCVLSAGPIAWLVTLPVALLAPLWGSALAEQIDDDRTPPNGWKHWYLSTLGGIVLSALLVAGWLFGAIFAGLEQDASLIDDSMQLLSIIIPDTLKWGRAWLCVLVGVCLFLLPWVFWMPAWRSVMGIKHLFLDGGARFCLFWFLFAVAAVSVFSESEVSLAGLALPPAAMMMAFLVFLRADHEVNDDAEDHRLGNGETVLGLATVIGGAALLIAPLSGAVFELPWWVAGINSGWGAVLMALGALVAYAVPGLVDLRMMIVSLLSALVVCILNLAAEPVLRGHFGPQSAVDYLADQIVPGTAVAYTESASGLLDFPARMTNRPVLLPDDDPVGQTAWLAQNTGAVVVTVTDQLAGEAQPLVVFPYGDRKMMLWLGETLLENPGVLKPVEP